MKVDLNGLMLAERLAHYVKSHPFIRLIFHKPHLAPVPVTRRRPMVRSRSRSRF